MIMIIILDSIILHLPNFSCFYWNSLRTHHFYDKQPCNIYAMPESNKCSLNIYNIKVTIQVSCSKKAARIDSMKDKMNQKYKQ